MCFFIHKQKNCSHQTSAFRPYPSPLMTSGLIQYGVPVTERTPVLDMQMVWSRLLAPKSPSFTLPAESRRMLAPERTEGSDQGELLACNGPKDLWSSFPFVTWLKEDLQAIIVDPKLLKHENILLKWPLQIKLWYNTLYFNCISNSWQKNHSIWLCEV